MAIQINKDTNFTYNVPVSKWITKITEFDSNTERTWKANVRGSGINYCVSSVTESTAITSTSDGVVSINDIRLPKAGRYTVTLTLENAGNTAQIVVLSDSITVVDTVTSYTRDDIVTASDIRSVMGIS